MLDRRSIGVAVAGATNFLNLYTPQAILPDIARDFGVSVGQTGWTITAPLLAVACVAPFAGTISDRLGRKTLIVTAAFAVIVPTLLVAAAPGLQAMVAWRFLQGLLLPFIFTVCIAYIGDECQGAAGVRAAGAYSVGTIFGGYAGRMICGLGTEFGGWRVGFLAVALVSLLGAAFVALVLPRERRFVPLEGGLRSALATYLSHLRTVRLLATCLIGMGMLFTNVGAYTYVNFYLAAPPFNLSPGVLGLVFTVYLVGMVTTSLSTRLTIRIGRRATLLLAVALDALGLVLTLVPHVGAVIAGLALMSGGLFVVQALSLGFIAATIRKAKSTAVGLYVTCYYVGGALGGVIPGGAWHHVGWPGVIAVLLAMAAAIATTGLLFWRDPQGY
ncbi:MFS transporter [Rhodovastum atsumiense]|uniref:MFS transporter n=1 Tax=Rhodovastum atsumiense TaxID=504468 RepID=A0A5M6IU10_9PROT|nr:MFS transporter [Rhodovastum atsumiense]KAA5611701.1 MFS transporter [Rhodovastum atsumiense]CAH2604277.1 MFS transporter [Rhodovastum atsumiense]